MSAVQGIIVAAGFIVLSVPMIAWMMRALRREREVMDRHRQEWIDGGRNPFDEPNFDIGSGIS